MSFFSWWSQPTNTNVQNFQGMGFDTKYSAMGNSIESEKVTNGVTIGKGVGPSQLEKKDISQQQNNIIIDSKNITSQSIESNSVISDSRNTSLRISHTTVASNEKQSSFISTTFSNDYLSFVKMVSDFSNKKVCLLFDFFISNLISIYILRMSKNI